MLLKHKSARSITVMQAKCECNSNPNSRMMHCVPLSQLEGCNPFPLISNTPSRNCGVVLVLFVSKKIARLMMEGTMGRGNKSAKNDQGPYLYRLPALEKPPAHSAHLGVAGRDLLHIPDPLQI